MDGGQGNCEVPEEIARGRRGGGGGWYANETNEGVGMLLHWDLGHSSIANSLFCFIFFCAGSIVQIHVATLNPLVNSCNNVHHLAGGKLFVAPQITRELLFDYLVRYMCTIDKYVYLELQNLRFRFDNSLM